MALAYTLEVEVRGNAGRIRREPKNYKRTQAATAKALNPIFGLTNPYTSTSAKATKARVGKKTSSRISSSSCTKMTSKSRKLLFGLICKTRELKTSLRQFTTREATHEPFERTTDA